MKIGSYLKYIIVTIVAIIMVIPLFLIIMGSLTPESEILRYGYRLVPKSFTLNAFRFVFNDFDKIGNGYKVSLIVTTLGTLISLLVTAALAYPLSRPDLKGHRVLSFLVIFTMLFNGGMVAWYIICTKYLGLKDTYAALILPMAVNPFFVFLLRNFFATLPSDYRESALIDGAGEWTIFIKIILPLSKPGMATIGLFVSLAFWNDWWLGLMLIDRESLFPLQILLRKIVSNTEFLQTAPNAAISMVDVGGLLPAEGVKMVTCLLTIGPVILFYPFIQKYFIKGITLGGVKG